MKETDNASGGDLHRRSSGLWNNNRVSSSPVEPPLNHRRSGLWTNEVIGSSEQSSTASAHSEPKSDIEKTDNPIVIEKDENQLHHRKSHNSGLWNNDKCNSCGHSLAPSRLPTPNPRRHASFDVEKIEHFKGHVLLHKNSQPDMELTLFPRTSDQETERKRVPSMKGAAFLMPSGHDFTQYVEWKCSHREWCILVTLVITTLVVALDSLILAPVLPDIAVSLDVSTTTTFWVGTSYILSAAACQPFMANLSDIFGRRSTLLLSLALFTAGSIMCCTAPNATLLLSGRSVQGIGGAGCLVLPAVIVTDIIPLRQRAAYQSLLQIAWAVGLIAGPTVGGVFALHLDWRWCFYINFPFCFAALIMTAVFVKMGISRPNMSFVAKIRSVDWMGGFLFIGSVCSFLMGISWAGSQHAWSSAAVIVPIVLGLLGAVSMIAWEKFGAQNTFIRLEVFETLTANLTFFCVFLEGFLLIAMLYSLALYFEACKGFTSERAGISVTPLSSGFIFIGIVSSVAIVKLGRYRWAIWLGSILTTMSTGLIIIFDESSPAKLWAPLLVLAGCSQGLLIMSLTTSTQAAASAKDVAYAASTFTFFRSFGSGVGAAIVGTIFQNVMVHHLSDLGLPTAIAKDSVGFVTILGKMSASATKDQYILAYTYSFRNVYMALTGISALGIIGSIFIKEYSMNKRIESVHFIRVEDNKEQSGV